jgi:putative transposase
MASMPWFVPSRNIPQTLFKAAVREGTHHGFRRTTASEDFGAASPTHAMVRAFTKHIHNSQKNFQNIPLIIKFGYFYFMNSSIISQRKSFMLPGDLYFWTATIHNWNPILQPDYRKEIIIKSLSWIKENELAQIYSYVIMPNHLHLIWKTAQKERKESVQGTLLKHTAHLLKKDLMQNAPELLSSFRVMAANKQFQFWQRDSLAIKLYTREVAYQKLNYIHQNPVAKKWNLSPNYVLYKYSSAAFYEYGFDPWGLVTHINEVI